MATALASRRPLADIAARGEWGSGRVAANDSFGFITRDEEGPVFVAGLSCQREIRAHHRAIHARGSKPWT